MIAQIRKAWKWKQQLAGVIVRPKLDADKMHDNIWGKTRAMREKETDISSEKKRDFRGIYRRLGVEVDGPLPPPPAGSDDGFPATAIQMSFLPSGWRGGSLCAG